MNKNHLTLIKNDQNLRLETERLSLEPILGSHAPLLLTLLQDSALYIFIPQDPPALEALHKRYKIWEARQSPDGTEIWLNWAARLRAGGDYIGHFQAGFDDLNGFTVAYTLGRAFQRQGYATESLAAVIHFLREKMTASSVKAFVDTRNARSIALLRRLGFKEARFIKSADTFKGVVSDEFVFELAF